MLTGRHGEVGPLSKERIGRPHHSDAIPQVQRYILNAELRASNITGESRGENLAAETYKDGIL